MTSRQPERSFGFLIADVARLMTRNFDRRAQKIGLSRAQWQVLAWLKHNEGISQTKLADLLEISPMTLVRLIDRLQARGLVERRPDPADRRIYRLHLAQTAHPMLEQLWRMGTETRRQALPDISPEEEAMLIEILGRMRRNLTEAKGGAGEAPVAEAAQA
jgi:MarR family transcriptional regulator, transcriptional regulator for hemolysin